MIIFNKNNTQQAVAFNSISTTEPSRHKAFLTRSLTSENKAFLKSIGLKLKMTHLLDVLQKPLYEESIIKKEYHSYSPYLKSFDNNDEVRIAIQNQDLYVLPSESVICIQGTIAQKAEGGNALLKIRNNFFAYLFEEIRYEINGFEVDRTRNLGVTTTIKNYISLNESEGRLLKNAGWDPDESIELTADSFNMCVPLKILLGFAEDYNKVLLNWKHELILQRSKSDEISYYALTRELKILDISWKIPHVQLSDSAKLQMYKVINSKATMMKRGHSF